MTPLPRGPQGGSSERNPPAPFHTLRPDAHTTGSPSRRSPRWLFVSFKLSTGLTCFGVARRLGPPVHLEWIAGSSLVKPGDDALPSGCPRVFLCCRNSLSRTLANARCLMHFQRTGMTCIPPPNGRVDVSVGTSVVAAGEHLLLRNARLGLAVVIAITEHVDRLA